MNFSFNISTKYLLHLFLLFIAGASVTYFLIIQDVHYKYIALLPVIFFGVFFLKPFLMKESSIKLTIYLLICSTFLNNAFISIDLGLFTLFPYRVLLVFIGSLIVYNLLISNQFRDVLWQNWTVVKVNGSLLFLILWVFYSIFSLLWARSVTDGIKYISILIMGIFFISIVLLFLNKINDLTKFYYIWLVMSAFIMLLGFWNYITKKHLPSSSLYNVPTYRQQYPTSVFTNQNDLATFLVITLFFYLSLVKNGRNIYLKCLGAVAAIASLILIYFSDSRGSQLAVVIGLFIYGFIILKDSLKKWIVILFGGGTTVFFLIFHNKIFAIITDLFLTPKIRGLTGALPSNMGRINLTKNSLHFIVDSYGLGVGAGNAEHYMLNYGIYDTDNIPNVHNWFLEIFVNQGILIFLGYVTLYVFILFKLYQHYKRKLSQDYKLIVEATIVSLGAFFIASISPSSVMNLFFHWVFLAFALATLNILRNNQSAINVAKSKQEVLTKGVK